MSDERTSFAGNFNNSNRGFGMSGGIEEEVQVCPTCNTEPARESHPCPYHSDVNNDDGFRCTCCERCENNCADDI